MPREFRDLEARQVRVGDCVKDRLGWFNVRLIVVDDDKLLFLGRYRTLLAGGFEMFRVLAPKRC